LACGHIAPISPSSHGLLCVSSPFLFLVRTPVIGFSPHSQVPLVVKNPPASAGDARDVGSIPGSGRSPGEGHGNQLQYSCLENPMDRGAWWAMVHMVPKSQTQLKRLSTTQHGGNLELNYIFKDSSLFLQMRAHSQFSECAEFFRISFGAPPFTPLQAMTSETFDPPKCLRFIDFLLSTLDFLK